MANQAVRRRIEWSARCGAALAGVKAFAFGCCLFGLGTLLQWHLVHSDVTGVLFFLDNALMAVIAGLAMLFYERHRNRELRKRAETIGLMNHHVRNALQVISATSYQLQNHKDTARVYDAVKRIEWALREVLPGQATEQFYNQ